MNTPGNSGRIVVADDESHIRNVVALKLRNAGFEIIEAADGQEAFDLVCENAPDLLITDYHMPRMTGVELVASLRERAASGNEAANVRSIILTAQGNELPDDVEGCNVRRVLSKPFSPRQLVATVQEVLSEAA